MTEKDQRSGATYLVESIPSKNQTRREWFIGLCKIFKHGMNGLLVYARFSNPKHEHGDTMKRAHSTYIITAIPGEGNLPHSIE